MEILARISLLLALACTFVVTVDVMFVRRQQMAIMNVVWPLTMLWSGPIGLAVYFLSGRGAGHRGGALRSTIIATTHCGSGCTLGDVAAESLAIFWPLSLFGNAVFGTWLIDFVCAFALGIVFQYFSIVPMRKLSPREGLIAALKADAASLIAWQIGMYGWMAIALFALYSPQQLPKSGALFWFMMQIAMFAGFLVSFPVNAWLLRAGIKEAM